MQSIQSRLWAVAVFAVLALGTSARADALATTIFHPSSIADFQRLYPGTKAAKEWDRARKQKAAEKKAKAKAKDERKSRGHQCRECPKPAKDVGSSIERQ